MKPTPRTLLLLMLSALAPIASAEVNPATVSTTTSDSKESGSAWRASTVIGSSVKNSTGEVIGKVDDLIVDVSNGQVLAMVVSTGGFLGIGDSLSSLPPNAVKYDAASKAFITALSKEDLGKLPQTKPKSGASAAGQTAGEKMRAARDSIGGDVNAADNTARNDKDMGNKALTPVDQGNSEADLKTTKDIRMAVVGSDVSFNAKNVKIITKDGKVTLRGVVESKAEKEMVVKTAKEHAGSATVTDELSTKKD